MKRIFLLLGITIVTSFVFAQSDEFGRISVKAYQPEGQNLTEDARRLLENKMQQIITANAMADNNLTDRFVMNAKVTILQKDVMPTTPPKIQQKIELTFFIGDLVENKVYSSTSVTVSGIGENENKCFIQAFQRINPNQPQIQAFVQEAKTKIANYYSQNCSSILAEAKVLEQTQQYDAAIAKLVAIPKVCENCYTQAMDAAISVYQKKINNECQILLLQAKSAWLAGQDSASAEKAFTSLSQINPQADCMSDAENLWNDISTKFNLQREEKKQFEQQQYREELKFKKQQYADEIRLREMNIKAAERIGVAYGENQPRVKTTNIGWLW